jgi:hypothetical protein
LIGARSGFGCEIGGTVIGDISILSGGSLHNDGVLHGDVVAIGGSSITGSGEFNGMVTIGSGGIFSPGGSPGAVTTNDTLWNAGGTYLWEINATEAAGGTAGGEVGWDLWNTGTLEIGGPFTILLATLNSENEAGQLEGWNPYLSHQWLVATAASDAFVDLSSLELDFTHFSGLLEGGTFSLAASTDGHQLYVKFTAVPEASTLFLTCVSGVFLLLLGSRQQSRPRE